MCQIIKFDNRLQICITTDSHLGIHKRPSRSSTSLGSAMTGTIEQTRWPCSHAKKILHVGFGAEGAALVHRRGLCVCAWATRHILMWGRAGWSGTMTLNEEWMILFPTVPVLRAAAWLPSLEGSASFHRQVKNRRLTILNDWKID